MTGFLILATDRQYINHMQDLSATTQKTGVFVIADLQASESRWPR